MQAHLPSHQKSSRDDQHTPLIPITPIEDEDSTTDVVVEPNPPNALSMSSQPQLLATGASASQSWTTTDPKPPANGILSPGMARGIEPDVVAAASVAFSAVMSNINQGNLIDHELLIKILNDPKLIENLIRSHRVATNPQVIPKPSSTGITLPGPPPPVHDNKTEAVPPSLAATPSRPLYSTPSEFLPPTPTPTPTVRAPVTKDINYYKSLIQQHGEQRQEALPQFVSNHNGHLGVNLELVNNSKPRDSKPKIMKPCIYFNSSRGCRHGANCAYLRDASSQPRVIGMPEVQSAKIRKIEREITGT